MYPGHRWPEYEARIWYRTIHTVHLVITATRLAVSPWSSKGTKFTLASMIRSTATVTRTFIVGSSFHSKVVTAYLNY